MTFILSSSPSTFEEYYTIKYYDFFSVNSVFNLSAEILKYIKCILFILIYYLLLHSCRGTVNICRKNVINDKKKCSALLPCDANREQGNPPRN
ncbi:hypothetical protein FKM82_018050 [Ascaphus truei]